MIELVNYVIALENDYASLPVDTTNCNDVKENPSANKYINIFMGCQSDQMSADHITDEDDIPLAELKARSSLTEQHDSDSAGDENYKPSESEKDSSE